MVNEFVNNRVDLIMRVLLVEDDPTTLQSIQMMLESAGMVVDTADLGEDGLEIGKLYE